MKKFLVLFVFLTACSLFTDEESPKLKFSVENEMLVVKNGKSQRVFYFVVEQNYAAQINWTISASGPYINAGSTVRIPFTEIPDGTKIGAESGDTIIFYWWLESASTVDDVENKIIHL